MNKLKLRLSEVMRGRNGMDDIGRIIFISFLLVYFFSILLNNNFLRILSFLGFICTVYRIFSKDLKSRQEENRRYLQFLSFQKLRFDMRKEYRIFKCKGCGRNIRVPKGKGKIEVTCPLCGEREIHRT